MSFRKPFYLLFFLLLTVLPGAVWAQASNWQDLHPQYGFGKTLCANSGADYHCFALQCHPDRGLEFAFYTSSRDRDLPSLAVLSVDGRNETVQTWRDVGQPGQKVQNIDYATKGKFLAALGQGRTLEMRMKQLFQFQISGADKVIDDVFRQCANHAATRYKTYAELAAEHDPNERSFAPEHTYLSYLQKTDSWGQDLDSGLSNPALRNISENDCVRICLGRADCKLATYNAPKKVCLLKRDFGQLIANPEARTTFVELRPSVPLAPALPGSAPVTTRDNRASPLIPWETTVAKRRAASVALGGNCQAELADVQRVAGSIKILEAPEQGIAGQAAALEWQSRPLSQRVPAWVVLSADRPVRFEGDGSYGLNAGAIGPFGIEVDRDKQRAIAPIYTKDTLTGARIGVIPLEAGPYELRATLVTYLRACQQEVPVAQTVYKMNVDPAAPQIVLRDVTEAYPFDRRIEVPEYGRRIELNDERFVIQHSVDGSEVLSREGKDLRLSPTKRFVTITNADGFEILDIVDGQTVGTVEGSMLAFWNADSFFLTDYAPWGDMRFGATILPRDLGESLRTGSSCCYNGGNGITHVDLENNVANLAGRSFSLLKEKELGTAEANSYAAVGSHSLASSFRPELFSVVDAVAPIYAGDEWNLLLGPFYTQGFKYANTRKEEDPEDNLIQQMATLEQKTVPNPNFGQPASAVKVAEANVITRGATSTDNSGQGFVQAMARIGAELQDGLVPRTWLRSKVGFVETEEMTPSQIRDFNATVPQIERDVQAARKQIQWSKYVKDPDAIGHFCEHFPDSGQAVTGDGEIFESGGKSAHDLNLAYRFNLGNRIIWVTRASCRGGTLGSNLVSSSALNIFDTASKLPTHAAHRVDEWHTAFSNFSRGLFETGFETKLFQERYIATYAPGEGAIMVFDLTTRAFLMKIEYARRGDLLADVFLSADAKFLYQLNTNGSFTVYDVARQAPVLEGRYLDDEIVIWTATFHFDSTEEGDAFVELRFPGQPGQYSFQQFQNALRVPGLMRQVLDGSITLPEIDVSIPPKLEGRVSANSAAVEGVVRVTAQNTVKELSIFQDGVLTGKQTLQNNEVAFINTGRMPGARWVSVVAEDAAGLISLPINVDLGGPGGRRPRTHFFGVGVDYYQSDDLASLNYAKRDVLRLSKTFEALDGQTIDLVSSTLLADRRASETAILTKLSETVAAAQPGDHLVLFMAGHGLRSEDGTFYLGLSKTDLSDLGTTGLRWSKLAEQLARRDIRITILLDACHAGAAGSGAFATNDGAVGALIDKGQANVTVIAAAKGRQFSGESSDVGGGYFTAAVSEVLLEKRAEFDKNGNGALEAVEFYRGVKSLVVRQRGLEQTPWMVRNQVVGEYALF